MDYRTLPNTINRFAPSPALPGQAGVAKVPSGFEPRMVVEPRALTEYRVQLEVYNGPLDLLLYLIKRDELDIYDIPIKRILDSYMQYVSVLKDFHDQTGLDINVAGDFLVMAATLMEVKSAMLLPRQVEEA